MTGGATEFPTRRAEEERRAAEIEAQVAARKQKRAEELARERRQRDQLNEALSGARPCARARGSVPAGPPGGFVALLFL